MQGVIVNCFHTALRDAPSLDAKLVVNLVCLTEIEVVLARSNESFYCVITPSDCEGFCLKQYVALREQR